VYIVAVIRMTRVGSCLAQYSACSSAPASRSIEKLSEICAVGRKVAWKRNEIIPTKMKSIWPRRGSGRRRARYTFLVRALFQSQLINSATYSPSQKLLRWLLSNVHLRIHKKHRILENGPTPFSVNKVYNRKQCGNSKTYFAPS
jgi:hypothetical protein